MNKIKWAMKISVAGILFQTLFFKFSAAPESVYIFSKLNVEPWGRIASGVSELIAGVFILIPLTSVIGELLIFLIISGALLCHLFILGLSIQNDGGLLFLLAIIVFVLNLILLFLDISKVQNLLLSIKSKGIVHE